MLIFLSFYAIIANKKIENFVPMIDLNNQSKQIEEKQDIKCSAIVEPGKYLLTCDPKIKTLLDCIYRGYQISKEDDCTGIRSPYTGAYEWFTYDQTLLRMKTFGSGLVGIGCEPNNKTIVAFYGRNNFKLLIAEYACYHYSIAIVPIYDTTESNTWKYILNQIEPKCVIVDSNEIAKRLLLSIKPKSVNSLVLMCDHIHEDTTQLADKLFVKLYTFTDVEKIGIETKVPFKIPNPTDLAVISYTSGTTGKPKGALLTHSNLVATASAILMHLDSNFNLKDETMISYSSIAHLRDRILKVCMFYSGGRIGIYSGDFKDLSRDLPVLMPTIMICVPRILNRIYNRVISKVRGNWVRSRFLDIALKSKQPDFISNTINSNSSIWDKVVFKTVKMTLGGNIKLLISGSSQISTTVLTFMRSALGCQIIEGYGLTECSSFVTLTHCGDQSSTGHLGPPIPCNELKLVDMPEFNLIAARDGCGEVCVKGTNVFSGFYKNYEIFESAVDKEGWFHTGDIGHWLKNGTLKVFDRKEHLFQINDSDVSEYIAPDKIENIYIQSIYVGQCFVDADFNQGSIIGIIVPDVDGINLWCSETNMLLSAAEACRNVGFKKAVLNDILNIGKREGLKPCEQVTDIHLHIDPFTQESGFLTPTMKLKRHKCKTHFKEQIEEMSQKDFSSTIQKII